MCPKWTALAAPMTACRHMVIERSSSSTSAGKHKPRFFEAHARARSPAPLVT